MLLHYFVMCGFLMFAAQPVLAQVEQNMATSTEAAANMVRPLLKAFVDNDQKQFSELVAPEFVPNKIDLMKRVSDSFFKARPVNLDFVTGQTLGASERKTVLFRWNRTSMDAASRQTVKKEGDTEFVFILKDKNYLLCAIKGDDPFSP